MRNDRSIPVNSDGSVVTFSVQIEGKAILEEIQVLRLSVSKEINKIATASLSIIDGDASKEDFPVSNQELFVPGKEIAIFAGHRSEEDLLFKGVIVKHGISIRQNGNSILKLTCKDTAYRMAILQKSRYFQDVSDTEVIEDILDEYGIESELADTEINHPELVQYDAYDWDFIINRADVNAKFCVIDDGVFKMIQADFEQDSILTLQYGATILEFDAEIDSRVQYKTVISQAWDNANQELVEIEAQEPEIEESGNLPSEKLVEAVGLEALILQHSGNIAEEALQNWADAKLQKSRLAKIRGRVKFEGFAKVKPGNIITLSGVGDRFNGRVFVSGVRHYLAEGEWETDVQFGINAKWFTDQFYTGSSPNAGISPAIRGLQIGVVRQIHEDPDGSFRILVNIPVIDADEEGIWCRVASLDAGEGRGFFFRPEEEDEVILGFINNNPGDAVVLGLLHSSAKPSPIEPTESNAEKGYVSGSEMKLLFNDEDVFVSIETPEGNKLILSEADSGISMEDQNGNKLLMNSDGILLESASDLIFKASGDVRIEATNIENKANASFKADGSAGGELTSSGLVKVKGSLVQIN